MIHTCLSSLFLLLFLFSSFNFRFISLSSYDGLTKEEFLFLSLFFFSFRRMKINL